MKDCTSQIHVDDPWEDLVVSILAVNQYSIEKTYPLVGALRQAGLANPQNLALWDVETIVVRLKAAGCHRGNFMNRLFAVRLSSLGIAVGARGIDTFTQVFLKKDPGEISQLLLPIKGIGPRVLQNFCMLRGIK